MGKVKARKCSSTLRCFRLFFGDFITNRNPGPAGCVDGCFEIGLFGYVINKFSDTFKACIAGVMCRKATTHNKFRCQIDEIIRVPAFIGIRKYKIKGTLQFFDKIMGISQARINIIRKSGLFEIN